VKITAASDGDVHETDENPEAPVIVGPTPAQMLTVYVDNHAHSNGCCGGQGNATSHS
jgi:hypothetical protein